MINGGNGEKGTKDQMLDEIVSRLTALNQFIETDQDTGRNYQIGHSFFTSAEPIDAERYRQIIAFEIAPLLREYWPDDANKANEQIKQLTADIQAG